MNRNYMAVVAASVCLGLAGCSTTPETVGTVGGAVVGGVAGHAIGGGSAVGTIGGAAVGAIVGHEIGEHADQDRAIHSCTYRGAAYSDGSLSCQNGYEYSCRDGSWVSGSRAC
jgi:osmotically inducible lipoprotein OsmB